MKERILCLVFVFCCHLFLLEAREYHVSVSGSDDGPGTPGSPLKTIQAAADLARPGDTILVHQGTYRERINPPRGGTSDINRITYMAAPGEEVVIKGSEIIDSWQKEEGSVWKVILPNEFFGDYNPYDDQLEGDWLNKKGINHHTGELFLNGKALFEKASPEDVRNPKPYADARTPEDALYAWYCEVDETNTTIWANFQEHNPNKELVEITVRPACFYPDRPGRDYITVSGFTMDQAATQWAAPTAEQPGLIGTHWSKGWIIENNRVSNSKSVGITLGKDRSTGQNVWMNNPLKDGATHYNEVIFRAREIGWSKEHIGSHVVRNNEIRHCEQAGIVGSLGGVFSQIYENHIHDIWVKRIYSGAEMGGIKIHASIDMIIRDNHIHNTGRGIWLDWMAQGTRVTRNLLYDNTTDDLFVEVNHGPFLIEHNILLSPIAIREWSEGGAYVHNLIAGKIRRRQVPGRFTPYHFPHSTHVAGLRNILCGDNRYFNNIFVGSEGYRQEADSPGQEVSLDGLVAYDWGTEYPNFASGNVYYHGAKPGKDETDYLQQEQFDPEISLETTDEGIYLRMKASEAVKELETKIVTTRMLGRTIVSEAIFEQADGSPYLLDEDFFGEKRDPAHPGAGPFHDLRPGENRLKVR